MHTHHYFDKEYNTGNHFNKENAEGNFSFFK